MWMERCCGVNRRDDGVRPTYEVNQLRHVQVIHLVDGVKDVVRGREARHDGVVKCEQVPLHTAEVLHQLLEVRLLVKQLRGSSGTQAFQRGVSEFCGAKEAREASLLS